ncbi:MAG: hypothetical protein QM765_30005 [Myxococcales bacterium]
MRPPACLLVASSVAAAFLGSCSCSCSNPPAPPCTSPECQRELVCDDGIDSDGDGETDCADADCAGEACGPELPCALKVCEGRTCVAQFLSKVCRPSKGPCDSEEWCDSRTNECPPDELKERGASCGAPGACEASPHCDGLRPDCPPASYQPQGMVCRPAQGECDVAEVCTGVDADCPPKALAPQGTVCRPAQGECDVVEVCTGADVDCPPDALVPMGTLCRLAAEVCDADEFCDGDSAVCPPDRVALAGLPCRPAWGPCDEPDYCDGKFSYCSRDARKLPGTVCRPAARPCDAPEVCSGTDIACPPEEISVAVAGTVCRDPASPCDTPEVCDGATLDCPPAAASPAPAGTVCRAKAGSCDVADVCDGASLECGADVVLPALTACGGSQTCTGHAGRCPSWRQESPLPAGDWYALVANAPNDVWVGGAPGATAHWNGAAWTHLPPAFAGPCEVVSVTSVWASAPDDLWAVGNGYLIRWDGARWELPMADSQFSAVWGTGSDEVWAVGWVLAHWNGQVWSLQTPCFSTAAVWGTARDNVWAVGDELLHWNGKAWTSVSYPEGPSSYSAVFGTGPADVWFGGANGELVHFDGATLSTVASASGAIADLWTAPGAEVFVTTSAGALEAVDRTGTHWRTVLAPLGMLRAVDGTSVGDLWTAGEGLPLHWDGAAWKERGAGTTHDVLDLAVAPDSSVVWASTTTEVLKGTRQGDWSQRLDLPPWLVSVNRLWTSGAQDLWVSGSVQISGAYTPVLAHWNGTAWAGVSPTNTPTAFAGLSSTDVWMVGLEGTATRWNGSTWQPVETYTTKDLYAVAMGASDDVWVGTKGATFMHWNGSQWSSTESAGGGDVVAMAAAPGKVWALQQLDPKNTALVTWDGTQLTEVARVPKHLKALWRRADSDVWAFGSLDNGKGAALRWDGTSWTVVSLAAAGEAEGRHRQRGGRDLGRRARGADLPPRALSGRCRDAQAGPSPTTPTARVSSVSSDS